MGLCVCSIILSTAQVLSPALHKNFTDADFDFKVGEGTFTPEGAQEDLLQICTLLMSAASSTWQVWNSYFSLAVLYINQPSLQLENLSPAKRKKVLDR